MVATGEAGGTRGGGVTRPRRVRARRRVVRSVRARRRLARLAGPLRSRRSAVRRVGVAVALLDRGALPASRPGVGHAAEAARLPGQRLPRRARVRAAVVGRALRHLVCGHGTGEHGRRRHGTLRRPGVRRRGRRSRGARHRADRHRLPAERRQAAVADDAGRAARHRDHVRARLAGVVTVGLLARRTAARAPRWCIDATTGNVIAAVPGGGVRRGGRGFQVDHRRRWLRRRDQLQQRDGARPLAAQDRPRPGLAGGRADALHGGVTRRRTSAPPR